MKKAKVEYPAKKGKSSDPKIGKRVQGAPKVKKRVQGAPKLKKGAKAPGPRVDVNDGKEYKA